MTAWLDGLVGRLTMYRLVVAALAVIQVAALVLSLLGIIRPGEALGMLASAAVLVATSYLANRLLALVFRVRPHTESTIITALLLFFILPPTLDPGGLAVLALAALLAVASKYLIAIRGRHVFNPAAFGAFAVGLFGLAFGAWWVGTPWLLPIVAIAAFAVLFRTRRLGMAGVYLAVALVVGVAQFVLAGAPFATAVQFVALSSPLVFFAGFMLSEPLTMPPRRWQQFAYAALVAVLTQVSFSFGPLYNSPEFALLVGNLLAFLVGQRRGIRLDYTGRRQLSPTAWEFDFRPVSPIAFQAGQFMELTLPHPKTDARGWRRVFSVASAPTSSGVVRFGIRLPERSSTFKRALLELEPGTRVSATTIGGDFVLPGDRSRPLLFVAGGIGITPFMAHLEQAAAEGGRDIVLAYAVSSNDDLAYLDRLEGAGCRVVIASPDRPEQLPQGWSWAGAGRLSAASLLEAVPDARAREVFLSGPPTMVGELKRTLRSAGVRRIHTDVFIGY